MCREEELSLKRTRTSIIPSDLVRGYSWLRAAGRAWDGGRRAGQARLIDSTCPLVHAPLLPTRGTTGLKEGLRDEGEGEIDAQKRKKRKKSSKFDCLVNLDMYYFYVQFTPPLLPPPFLPRSLPPAAPPPSSLLPLSTSPLPPAFGPSAFKRSESAGQRLHSEFDGIKVLRVFLVCVTRPLLSAIVSPMSRTGTRKWGWGGSYGRVI